MFCVLCLLSAIFLGCSLSNAAVNLTASSTSLCPGDAVVFSCITNTGRLTWITSTGYTLPYYNQDDLGIPIKRDIFIITLLNITGQRNNVYKSTAYAPLIPLTYDGESITCTDKDNSSTIELVIEPAPSPPLNLTFTSSSTLSFVTISWVAPLDTPLCVHSYTVTVRNSCNSSQVMIYNTTDNRSWSSLSIIDLTSDREYSVTVAGRDGTGRLGQESEELTIIRGSAIGVHCPSKQSICAMEEQPCGLVVHYLITHNVSSDQSTITVNRTNVTLYGVQPGEAYTVKITPYVLNTAVEKILEFAFIGVSKASNYVTNLDSSSNITISNTATTLNTTSICGDVLHLWTIVIPWVLLGVAVVASMVICCVCLILLKQAKSKTFQGKVTHDNKETGQAEEDGNSEAVDHTSSCVETPFSMNQNIAYSSVMISTHAAAV